MTKKKESCGTCPYQEAKQAIAKAEDDFFENARLKA